MDFSLTREQQDLQKSLREFANQELIPKMSQWDKNEEYPQEQILKMGKMGLIGVTLPAKYGGQNADHVTEGIVIEEIGRGDFACGYPVILAELMGGMINKYGSEEQKEQWLPAIIKGEKVISLGLTEPTCGSDATSIQCQAVKKGNEYVLNGKKASIDLYHSDAVIIFAKTDLTARASGITAFLVPGNTQGLDRTPLRTMGCKGARVGDITIDNVKIPVSNRVGEEGKGFYQVMGAFDCSRALMGLWCLGAAQGALEEAIQYAKTRSTFGKLIGKFQGVSFPLVENYTVLEAARLLCYRALWLRDQGLPHTKEAAMCKLWIPKLAADVIHHALRIHGYRGYTDQVHAEQRLRDVIGLETGDGAIEIMKLIVVRELMGRDFISN